MAEYSGQGGLAWLLARAMEGMVGPWRPGAPSPARRFNQFLVRQGQPGEAPLQAGPTEEPYDPIFPNAMKLPSVSGNLDTEFTGAGVLEFGDIEDALSRGDTRMAALVKEAEENFKKRKDAMEASRAGLVQAVGLPQAEPSVGSEFAVRLAGGISQAVAPQMQGQALAEQTLGQRRENLMRQQAMRLELIGKHHDTMADQFEKAGDIQRAAKERQASHRAGGELALALAKVRETGNVMAARARVGTSGKDRALQKLSFLDQTLKENLDAANQEVTRLESVKPGDRNKTKRARMAARRRAAELSAQRMELARSVLTEEVSPEALSGVNLLERIVTNEIRDAKSNRLDLRTALRMVDTNQEFSGDDETWQFGKYGIGKNEFKKALQALWDKVR